MADAMTRHAAKLSADLPYTVRVWFVVDATVDTDLLRCIARAPHHKATATNLSSQALMLWKALCSLTPYIQLHIMNQEFPRYQHGNGRPDIQAVHQLTIQLPSLQITDLDRSHTHLKHLPTKPNPIRPRTGCQKTPPMPHTTEPNTTLTRSNASHRCSATWTAARTSRRSERLRSSFYTTQRCAQHASRATCRSNALSSPRSNCHSSAESPVGSPAKTSTTRRDTPTAHATTPLEGTRNTSTHAPSMQRGTHWWAGPPQTPCNNTRAGCCAAKHTKRLSTCSGIP